MTKLMFAVHGDESSTLFGEPFRHDLAGAGVTQLQVNVDDDAVASALRFGPGEPISAIVSTWSEGNAELIVEVISSALKDPNLHAYRVTERVRLDSEPMPDGVRSDVMAQVAVLRRPSSMTQDEYLAYWMLRHTPIAIRTQNTSAYIQNIVEEALTPDSPEIAAIVEEHFPMASLSDPHAFYGSRGDDAELSRRMTELMTSVAAFGADQGLDLVPTSRYDWRLASALTA